MFKRLVILLIASFISVKSTSIPIYISNDYFLTTNISIGSNKQNFTVQLDTGSLPLWVNSKTCKIVPQNNGDAKNGPCFGDKFDTQLSTSFVNLNTPFSISYDDGTSITGTNVKDTIYFGNYSYNNFEFGLVNSETYQEGDQNWTIGMLGLTTVCCDDTQTSILESLYNDISLTSKLFSLYLPQDMDKFGLMTIGSVDSSLYNGEITWIPVTLEDESWNFQSITVEVSGQNSNKLRAKNGYFDTGSDVIFMPVQHLKYLCSSLNMKFDHKMDACYIECTKSKNVDNFMLKFGNSISILVNTQDYFIYPIDDNGDRVLSSQNCALAIATDKVYSISMSVLRQFYTIWQFDTKSSTGKIGFAQKKD